MDSTASPGRKRNTGHCATYVKNNRVLVAGETNIGLLTTWQRRQQGIVSDVGPHQNQSLDTASVRVHVGKMI